MMSFTLKGNPQSTNHLYRHRGHLVYMTAEGRALKESYIWQIKSQYKGTPKKGRISLRLDLYFGDKRKRDIDNYNKILLDSLTGILYEDDSQIDFLTITKSRDINNPRIEISL